MVSTGPRQQDFSALEFDVNDNGIIPWQQKFPFLRSIFTVIGKRGSVGNEAVLEGKKQTNVPALHKLPQLGCYLSPKSLCV